MSKESKGRKPGVLSRCLRFAGRRKPLVFASMALAVLSAAASFVPYVAIYLMIRDAVGVYPNLAAVDVSAMAGYAGLAVAGIVVDVGCYLAALLCSHAAAFDTQYRTKLDIAAHLGRIPLGHVARLGTGRISKVMDESVGGIEQFIGHSIPDLAATAAAPVVLAALLFVFSDATIAWNKFVEPLPDATLRIMSTYYAAQYLFALLALAASSRKAAAARP